MVREITIAIRSGHGDDGDHEFHHELEGGVVLGVGSGEAVVYVNAVFDTNGKASSGAQSAGKGLISWAFAVLPVYPTGLRKPCFSFQ